MERGANPWPDILRPGDITDIGHRPPRHNVPRSSGTSPNFLITLASLKSPVAGSPVRLNATVPT
jgi:hypothetical protein